MLKAYNLLLLHLKKIYVCDPDYISFVKHKIIVLHNTRDATEDYLRKPARKRVSDLRNGMYQMNRPELVTRF